MARKKQEPKKEKPKIKQESKVKKTKKSKWLSMYSKATKNVLKTNDDLRKLAKTLKWL